MNNRIMLRTLSLITAVLVMISLLLTGCGSAPASPTEAPTEAPTKAPYIDTDVNSPEWTPVAIPLFLKDNKYLYAEGSDFQCFAFVGTNDDDVELRFMLDDTTANMLKTNTPVSTYYISMGADEIHIGDVTLSEDCKIATLKGQHPFDEMTKIASKIRGLIP